MLSFAKNTESEGLPRDVLNLEEPYYDALNNTSTPVSKLSMSIIEWYRTNLPSGAYHADSSYFILDLRYVESRKGLDARSRERDGEEVQNGRKRKAKADANYQITTPPDMYLITVRGQKFQCRSVHRGRFICTDLHMTEPPKLTSSHAIYSV